MRRIATLLLTLACLSTLDVLCTAQATSVGSVPLAMWGGEAVVNSTSWQMITRTTYSSISSLFATIPVASGATRKYYLVIRRADDQPGGTGSNWRFSCNGGWNGGTWVPGHGFPLASDWGSPDEGSTDWVEIPPNAVSSACSPAYWEIDAEMANPGKQMRVMNISMTAVDVVGGTNIGYSQAASGADAQPAMSLLQDTVWLGAGNNNIGINTSAPSAALEVNGNVKLTSGSGASMTYADGTTQSTAWTGVLCGGDYAEAVNASGGKKSYEPGDVLVLASSDSGDVQKSSEPYSTMVAGIYATKPGVIGRRQNLVRDADDVPMAMVGIVPTKVSAENGPIRKGDLLVTSSIPGYAMRGTDRSRMFGAVIGKAMGALDSGRGVIQVLVTLQ